MKVSLAKHGAVWLTRKYNYRTDKQTHRQTDTGQNDPYVLLFFERNTTPVSFGDHSVTNGAHVVGWFEA